MLIKYVGPFRRTVGPYAWQPDGSVEIKEAETAANLLSNPGGDFEIDPKEPLLAVAGERAAELVLAGVGSVTELADLDKDGIKRVATELGATQKEISTWVDAARAIEN